MTPGGDPFITSQCCICKTIDGCICPAPIKKPKRGCQPPRVTAPMRGPAIPKGWKLVPKEPTDAMIHAVWKATLGGSLLSAERAARALLAASPVISANTSDAERLHPADPSVLEGMA